MNTKFNLRKASLFTLLGVTACSVLLIFADDNRPLSDWIEVRIYLAAVACVCGFTLRKLTQKWTAEGKISNPVKP